MTNRQICVVTGANRGIGRAITEGIIRQGHKVVMVCRNENTGLSTLKEIHNSYGKDAADLVIGDLSSLSQIKNFALEILDNYPHIDILIHNVAIWPSKLVLNDEGLEHGFFVNHLASFYLTHLLLERLKRSTPARIVFVNAGIHTRGNVDLQKTPWGKDFGRFGTYFNTKLCNILFMRELANHLEGTGIITNAVCPGPTRTDITNFKGILRIVTRIASPLMSSTKKAAKGPINLALNPNIQTNGSFYEKLTKKDFHKKANDQKLMKELWLLSKQLCRIENYGVTK